VTPGAEQFCIVCEQLIDQNDVAPDVKPWDWFVCKTCGTITPDRAQAEAHWTQRYPGWKRRAQIEVVAKEAYDHLVYLDQHRMLTVGGLMIMKQLKEALEP
jgi:hypothetical protein